MQDFEISLLVFDMNAIAYASAYQPNLAKLSHKGKPTGVIHGALNSFLSIWRAHPSALPLVLWDGSAQWRRTLYPAYKSNRGDTPEKLEIKRQVREQVPIVQMLLQDFGVPQARHPDAEADDLAWLVTSHARHARVRTRMVTTDSDWWQAVGDGVDWVSSLDKRVVDHATLRAMGAKEKAPADGWASPQEYLQAKIIAGDNSDAIEGIAGAGMATAAKMLRTSENGLDGILRGEFSAKGVVADRLRESASLDILRRNRQLMDWSLAPIPQADSLALWAYEADLAAAARLASDFGLEALARRCQTLDEPGAYSHLAWPVVIEALEFAAHRDNAGP